MPYPVMMWAQWKTSHNQAHLTSTEQVAYQTPKALGLAGSAASVRLCGSDPVIWKLDTRTSTRLTSPSLAPGSSFRVAFNAASSDLAAFEVSRPMDLSLPSCKVGRMAVISWR